MLSAAGATLLARDSGHGERPTATSTATSIPDGGCPVETAVCDFARLAEYELQEGDPRRLISPKSKYGSDPSGQSGVVDTILGGPDKATKARVFAIGCPLIGGAPSCSEYFSLVFTARAEGDELGGGPFGSRELLAFQRDGGDLPILTLRAAMPAVDQVVKGGEFGRCYTVDVPAGCGGTMFYPFTTGTPVAVSPTPISPPLSADDPFAGIEVRDLVAGAQASIGYDTVVYHSNDSGILSRTYRSADGELHTENLFRPLMELTGGHVFQFAADWERGHLLVKVCASGYCGGEDDPSADATVRVFRSRDGGATYSEEDASGLPVWSYLRGFVGDDAVVVGMERRGLDYVTPYLLYQSMAPLTPPTAVGRAEPQADAAIGIGWLDFVNGSGYYDSSGKRLIPGGAGKRLNYVVPLPSGHRIAHWIDYGVFDEYTGLYDGEGRLVRAIRSRHLTSTLGQLPSGLLFGNVAPPEPFAFEVDAGASACTTVGSTYASLLDLNTGTVHPILELAGCTPNQPHGYLVHIQARAVLRVATNGDCLNVRKEPSASSESVGCFADGVLLGLRGDGPPPIVPGWRAVMTPALEPGWAAEEFLRR